MNKFNYFPWLLLLNIDRVITALVNASDFSLPCIISLFKVATNPCFKGEKVNITSIAELVHVTQRVSSRLSRQRHPSGALSDYFFFLVSGRNCPARNLGPFAPGSSAVRGVCAVLCCAAGCPCSHLATKTNQSALMVSPCSIGMLSRSGLLAFPACSWGKNPSVLCKL